MQLPELQSGWLADAVQQRWAEAGEVPGFISAAVCLLVQCVCSVDDEHEPASQAVQQCETSTLRCALSASCTPCNSSTWEHPFMYA